MNHDTVELACIGVGALALLMQAIVLLAIYVGISKSTKKLKEDVEDMRSSVMPIVEQSRTLLTRLSALTPKIESTVNNAAEVTSKMRVQAEEAEATVEDILARVRVQTSRVDGMFTNTLDAVDKASAFVSETVTKPVRQLSGLLAALKAIIESLRASEQAANGTYREPGNRDDTDLFV
jgi:ABC-type transporter Mla subunit MlaD